jgi:hypothetical protein
MTRKAVLLEHWQPSYSKCAPYGVAIEECGLRRRAQDLSMQWDIDSGEMVSGNIRHPPVDFHGIDQGLNLFSLLAHYGVRRK